MNHTSRKKGPAAYSDHASRRREETRPRLQDALRRIHLGLVLLSVGSLTLLFTLLGIFTLRAYTQDNLHLLARSIGYTVEAAIVFDDPAAAEETLANIVRYEPLNSVQICRTDGSTFAQWHNPRHSTMDAARNSINSLLLPPLTTPLMRGDQTLGTISLQSDGSNLFFFMVSSLVAALLCMLVTIFISLALSRRITHDVADPLQAMADVVHDVRYKRSNTRRIPRARIAELDTFGEDLNALLAKLAQRQARLLRENETLALHAKHDSLTGLVNRRTFEHRIEIAIQRAHVNKSVGVAVLFLDCDNFKTINDTHGHAAGDMTLQIISQRLRDHVRESDTVTRFGGDEFGILLSALRNVHDAKRVAENIKKSMLEPIVLQDGTAFTTSLTIGIAMFPIHAQDTNTLLRCADLAMYNAKRKEKGSIDVLHSNEAAPFGSSDQKTPQFPPSRFPSLVH